MPVFPPKPLQIEPGAPPLTAKVPASSGDGVSSIHLSISGEFLEEGAGQEDGGSGQGLLEAHNQRLNSFMVSF